jgi:GT2 family glycosyltransferase
MALPTPWNQALRSDFLMQCFPRSRLWGSGEAYSSAEPVAVEAVSGACMLLRTETYLRLGGFRPEYFMYAEDMDLCFRIHRLGLRIYHVPAAEILHHGGGSSNTQVSQFSTVKLRDATVTYMRLNHGRLAAWQYRLFQGCASLLRMILTLPLLPPTRTEGRKRAQLALTRGWYVVSWAFRL